MWDKPKDSKNSWEQVSWEFAVQRYARCKTLLNSKLPGIREYAEKTIEQLEEKYPQLKEKDDKTE